MTDAAGTLDEKVRRIIDDQYETAPQMLTAIRHLLVETADQLLTDRAREGETRIELAGAVTPAITPDDRPAPG